MPVCCVLASVSQHEGSEMSPLIPYNHSGHLMETQAGMLETIRDCHPGSAASHTFGWRLDLGR